MAMGAERVSVYDGQAAKFVVQFSTSPARQRWFSPFAGVSPGLQRDSAASARQKRMVSRSASQMGATCAIAGSVLLFIGTYLHPMGADPNQAIAAFAEYAADRLWVASHLTQLAGLALIVAALLLLGQQFRAGSAAAWAAIAAGAGTVSLAVSVGLPAACGHPLKVMGDPRAARPSGQ